MTVKELIDKLAEFPPDLEVVVASDPEGNVHRMLDERMGACYAEGEYEYEVYDEDDWDEEERERPYPGDNCLVIGP